MSSLTLGVVANPDEIAINQPQRNQSLLPRDSCRSLRVVFPLHPVSVPVMDLSTLRWIRNKSSIVLLGAFSASCCIFNQPPWEVVGLALALGLSPDPFKGSVNENPLPWGFAPAKRMVELMVGKWSDSNHIMLQKNSVLPLALSMKCFQTNSKCWTWIGGRLSFDVPVVRWLPGGAHIWSAIPSLPSQVDRRCFAIGSTTCWQILPVKDGTSLLYLFNTIWLRCFWNAALLCAGGEGSAVYQWILIICGFPAP